LDIPFVDKEKIASLLTMQECISIMEKMFHSLAKGDSAQPLRSLMWLPDKKGLLGMMPGYNKTAAVMGIKLISVFHGNRDKGFPSDQGVVVLFDADNGQPLMIFDASEITALRTAAASAFATKLLSREDSELLSIIGSGEQAERHIESILLVRKIRQINIWSRNENHAHSLAEKTNDRYSIPNIVYKHSEEAVKNADIICTVTSSPQPVVRGDWISKGTHINAVGSSTPATRELDTNAIVKSKMYTDCYESILNEAGDFLIPKKERVITDSHIRGDLGEVLLGIKEGRKNKDEITLFKSLGIASEDIFSCWHIYQKINGQQTRPLLS
jgi:ornithine cyclodeaminase/alanine dehydrogenase-like protein (mu-crystallin family)